MLIILGLVVVFHCFVIAGVVPRSIVWGGNISSDEQFYQLETVSITLNLLMILVVLCRTPLLSARVNQKIVRVLLWLMAALFLLNTIGNLFSKNDIERIVFTPLTLLLAFLSIVLARNRKAVAVS